MLTVPDIIQQSAFQYPDRCAISVGDKHFTFAEVDDFCKRTADATRDIGSNATKACDAYVGR